MNRPCVKCGKVIDGKNPSYCKACAAEYAREHRKKNPGKAAEAVKRWQERNPEKFKASSRKWKIKSKYGISSEEYDEMINEQENACAICREEFNVTPHVDHDHETGAVRGLLCGRCNTGLGHFRNSPAILKAASAYVADGSLLTSRER